MTFTIVVGWWLLPILLTIAIWVVAFLWPNKNDCYGIGAFLIGVFAIIATLSTWLIYFAVAFFLK
jgi:hypothetical protein